MAWSTPQTWTSSQFIDATTMNREIRDNLLWLKDRVKGSSAITINTTSTSFVQSLTGSVTLTSVGGKVLIVFVGVFTNSSASILATFDFMIDGVQQGDATNGTIQATTHSSATSNYPICIPIITQSAPSAGSHLYTLIHKTASGTLTGSGTLWCMEVG